ncbi:Clock-controlled 8 [Fusarium napiforme]|uniref:Clock-controlled 8 n=1 Tax=Fusarium napiforme TaxID=42672 RepID=A0A8H5JDY5_9HYPO|nr:Clock-controlled 8 [Fusarium napiforme]
MEPNHMLPDRESESRHVLGPPPARPQSLMAFSPPAYSNVASPNSIKFPDVPSDIPTSLPPLARFDADNDTKLPPLSSLTSEMAMEPTKTWLPFHPVPYPPVHAHSIDSPTRMDLDGSSNSVVSAASPDALLDARASSVSLDDPDVRLAAEALGDLRAVSPPTSGLQSNQPQSPQPEPLLSLLTTTHPLLASTIEGATSAYGGAKNFSPRFRSGAEYVEGYLTPIANTVGSVGRVTGVEGGVRWFLGAGRRQNSSTSDLETGNSKKRRKTDEDEAVSNKRFESEGMQQMGDEQMDTAPSPSSKTMSRRMSTTSTVDTLPAYDELRSPAYTETDSNSPRPSRPNSAWQSRLITSTSGLSVAMSQESLRSLKYCLQWLRWANDHIARVISALKTTLDEYEKVPDGQAGEQADPESRSQLAARISNLKGDVLRTLREAINTVSKYAGGALPENARILVRRHLTSLPQRFRVATMTDRNAGQQDNETALTEGAHKVLVLAKEGLDMVVQVSGVVDGTIVSAEQWLDRMGKRRAQEDEKPMLPQTESLLHDPDIQSDTLDLVCPINSDDIKNRWLNSYVPLPGQSPKNYSQSVINFVYRMLKSYASTVIRGRLPPFIHPMQQSLVPLSTCFTLVRICDPLPSNVSIAADILQREMTRLYEERETHEGINLLGVFQAYLIYSMVLFFHLGPSMPFLRQAMINLQEIACTTSREGLVCTAEQRGAVPKWESWIMAEAKRRTLYTMYFLDNVLSAHDGITTYLGTELRGLYSPASKYLWLADRNGWVQSYNSHLAEWGIRIYVKGTISRNFGLEDWKRIKIVLLLGAGGIATALTLFRVAKAVDFLNSDDITVDYTPIGILTALEITIGFVCACLPSLNLLIEHHVRKRRRARNPNWPRDRTRTSLFKKRFRWISSSTEHMPSRPNRPSDGMIDLDVEMAMLTGQPVRLRTGRTASAGSHDIRPLDHRLNSGDGRREGWLSQDRDEQDEVQDSKFIMRMVEESRARADEGAKESWCPVWDGPRDPMASQGSWKFSARSH